MLCRLRRLWARLRDEYTVVTMGPGHGYYTGLQFYRIRNRFTGAVRLAGPLPPEHVNCRCVMTSVGPGHLGVIDDALRHTGRDNRMGER